MEERMAVYKKKYAGGESAEPGRRRSKKNSERSEKREAENTKAVLQGKPENADIVPQNTDGENKPEKKGIFSRLMGMFRKK
jgi:hypothetical protein